MALVLVAVDVVVAIIVVGLVVVGFVNDVVVNDDVVVGFVNDVVVNDVGFVNDDDCCRLRLGKGSNLNEAETKGPSIGGGDSIPRSPIGPGIKNPSS